MIHHFDIVDSTNTAALDLAARGAAHGTVVHADRQTGGRGRGGRSFLSPAGGLYFSLILRPRLDMQDLPLITLAAGVGVGRIVKKTARSRLQLKWPNDLYLDDRKLAGILTQSGPVSTAAGPEYVVVGVGMNVNTDLNQFPSLLRSRVISLYHDTGCRYEVAELLASLVPAILFSVEMLDAGRGGVIAEWKGMDYLLNRSLEYVSRDQVIPATGVGLSDDGRYIIRDQHGVEHRILAGDINPVRLTS
jgi:BirA family biotin operon repressor/biotin-[acetyl-CoA-carboxylase] ligase